MKIRNAKLHHGFKAYIQGVCHNSLEWGPGRPQFEAFLDSLQKEESVVETVRWWDPDAEPRGEISKWALSFSYKYQDALLTLAWDEQVFDQVYEDFECFLYSRTLRVTYASPLYFFECSLSEPIELNTGVGIARAKDIKNIALLFNRFEVERYVWQKSDWCIYAYINISKSKPRSDSLNLSATAKIENVLTSLRLIDGTPVYVGTFYSDEGSPFAGIHGGYRSMMHGPLFGLPSSEYVTFRKYTLEGDNVDNLIRVYQWLSALTGSDYDFLRVPVSRFNASYMHVRSEDELIDLCIAMESLYVGEYQELGYKLALRGAYFLEHDAQKCSATFKRIRQVYKARSDIVHGGRKQPANLDELVSYAQEYLRRSILKLLSNPDDMRRIRETPKKEKLHFLDELILKGDSKSDSG